MSHPLFKPVRKGIKGPGGMVTVGVPHDTPDRKFKCNDCPFETNDEDAARAHIGHKGWLGKGEQHHMSSIPNG